MSPSVDHFGTKRLFLLEDPEPMRNVTLCFLRRCGLGALEAAGNSEIGALAPACARCGFVVCDYNLTPVDRNVQMLLEQAWRKGWITPGTIWAVLSGRSQPEKITVAEHASDRCWGKPVTEDAPHARLERHFDRMSVTAAICTTPHVLDCTEALALRDLRRVKSKALELSGELERAHAVCDDVLGKVDIAWMRLSSARVRQLQGDREGARLRLEDAVSKFPHYRVAYVPFVKAHGQLGQHTEQCVLLQHWTLRRIAWASPAPRARRVSPRPARLRAPRLERYGRQAAQRRRQGWCRRDERRRLQLQRRLGQLECWSGASRFRRQPQGASHGNEACVSCRWPGPGSPHGRQHNAAYRRDVGLAGDADHHHPDPTPLH